MKSFRRRATLPLCLLAGIAACSSGDGGTGPTVPDLSCSPGPAPTVMNAGEYRILNPNLSEGCLRLPAAAASGAEYLVAALSTAGQVTSTGVTIDYAMQGSSAAASAVAPLPSPLLEAWRPAGTAEDFHAMLRIRERALAASPGARFGAGAPPVQSVPPVVGVKDTFQVCGTTTCSSFKTVIATAKYVGPKGAIFLDDVVPAGGFTQADIDTLGILFDGGVAGTAPNMYQIDTTAFGRESDIDANGKVIFLLTDAVNDLSGSCTGGSIILGFFYGGDLLPRSGGNPGSNEAEIFYGLVPNTTGGCAVSLNFVKQQIAPVFIHEFQHMISYNQHVLVRPGVSGEEVWLNEGLSHFAEELGGRLLGNGPGPGPGVDAAGAVHDPQPAQRQRLPARSRGAFPDHAGQLDRDAAGARRQLALRAVARRPLRRRHHGHEPDPAAGGHVAARQRQRPGRDRGHHEHDGPALAAGELPRQPARLHAGGREARSTRAGTSGTSTTPSTPSAPTWSRGRTRCGRTAPRPGTYSRTGTLRGGSGRHLRILQSAAASGVDVVLARKSGEAFPDDRGVRFGVVRIR